MLRWRVSCLLVCACFLFFPLFISFILSLVVHVILYACDTILSSIVVHVMLYACDTILSSIVVHVMLYACIHMIYTYNIHMIRYHACIIIISLIYIWYTYDTLLCTYNIAHPQVAGAKREGRWWLGSYGQSSFGRPSPSFLPLRGPNMTSMSPTAPMLRYGKGSGFTV